MFSKGTYKNLIKTVKAAIFGRIAKKIVTDVGEPHKHLEPTYEKVPLEILNAKPTKINTMPNVKPYCSLFEL